MPTITYHGKKIRLTQQMFDDLNYAVQYPTIWHTIGREPKLRVSIERLEKAGLVEINRATDQFRVKA